jgi:inorganic triphosphatase YgiF
MKDTFLERIEATQRQQLGDHEHEGRRGLAVGAKKATAATKAERVQLAKNASVDEAVAVIFAACLKDLKANEAPALSGLDAEGIHQMRVALRRMRSAIADFQEIIPGAQVSRLKRETKWLLASLGLARDGDVFLSELLPPVETTRPGDAGLAELRNTAEAERETGYAEARRAIRSRGVQSADVPMAISQALAPGEQRTAEIAGGVRRKINRAVVGEAA